MRPRRSTVVVFVVVAVVWFAASYFRWAFTMQLPAKPGTRIHPDEWFLAMLLQALHHASVLASPLASAYYEARPNGLQWTDGSVFRSSAVAFGLNSLLWATVFTAVIIAITRAITRSDSHLRRAFVVIATLWFSMTFVLDRIYGMLIYGAQGSRIPAGWVGTLVRHTLNLTTGPDWMDWPIGTALFRFHHQYPHLGNAYIDYSLWAVSLALNAIFWATLVTVAFVLVRRLRDRRAASIEA